MPLELGVDPVGLSVPSEPELRSDASPDSYPVGGRVERKGALISGLVRVDEKRCDPTLVASHQIRTDRKRSCAHRLLSERAGQTGAPRLIVTGTPRARVWYTTQ